MGAIKREMNDPRWTAFAIGYMCVFAYVASFCVYQIGSLLTGAFFWYEAVLAGVAFLLLGGVIYLLFRKDPSLKGTDKKV